MTQTAEALGFTYSRKGCPCNGTPVIYKKDAYQLTMWLKRGVWQLKTKNCVLATGNKDNMTDKIKAIWDL